MRFEIRVVELRMIRQQDSRSVRGRCFSHLLGGSDVPVVVLGCPVERYRRTTHIRYLERLAIVLNLEQIREGASCVARLFADWPTPIVVVGKEVGAAVPFPGSSIATDFAGSPAHPVVEAYKAWKPMLYDAASQAVLAALYATDRKGDLLKLSEPGQIEVLDDGRTRFTPSTTGRHRYLLAGTDSEWKANVVKAFTALASAKPAAPMGRGPRPQQQQQQQAKPPQP